MCTKLWLGLTAAVLAFTFVPASAQDDNDSSGGDAVRFRGWGPRIGITSDPDQVHFGAHVDFGHFAEHIRFQPNVEVGIGDHLTTAAFNMEGAYRFASDWGAWSPYVGGGLGLIVTGSEVNGARDNSNTEVGVSALGGIEKGLSGGDRFFLEGKLGLVEAPTLKLGAGWTFY